MEKKFQFLSVRETEGFRVSSSQEVYDSMTEEACIDRECFWCLHLNARNEVIEKEMVSMGSVDHSPVHPREAFKKAILNGSSKVIFVHNHPSGNTDHSEADLQIFNQLVVAGYLVGIDVVDFIIISPLEFNSFRDNPFFFNDSKKKVKDLIFQAFNGSIPINPEKD